MIPSFSCNNLTLNSLDIQHLCGGTNTVHQALELGKQLMRQAIIVSFLVYILHIQKLCIDMDTWRVLYDDYKMMEVASINVYEPHWLDKSNATNFIA